VFIVNYYVALQKHCLQQKTQKYCYTGVCILGFFLLFLYKKPRNIFIRRNKKPRNIPIRISSQKTQKYSIHGYKKPRNIGIRMHLDDQIFYSVAFPRCTIFTLAQQSHLINQLIV